MYFKDITVSILNVVVDTKVFVFKFASFGILKNIVNNKGNIMFISNINSIFSGLRLIDGNFR